VQSGTSSGVAPASYRKFADSSLGQLYQISKKGGLLVMFIAFLIRSFQGWPSKEITDWDFRQHLPQEKIRMLVIDQKSSNPRELPSQRSNQRIAKETINARAEGVAPDQEQKGRSKVNGGREEAAREKEGKHRA